jgi:hypothetical protein
MLVVGLALLVILALMLFTDLGVPPPPRREHRVDDIQLRAPPSTR